MLIHSGTVDEQGETEDFWTSIPPGSYGEFLSEGDVVDTPQGKGVIHKIHNSIHAPGFGRSNYVYVDILLTDVFKKN